MSKTTTISVVVSDYSKRYNFYSINCSFKNILKLNLIVIIILIEFQQILKYCVITGSRLYININLKKMKIRGGGGVRP